MNWLRFKLNKEHFSFHLQYKHSGAFANRKYEELSHPQSTENVRPHSSNCIEYQSSREKATPSSGTSPLASYKEVPPHKSGAETNWKEVEKLWK